MGRPQEFHYRLSRRALGWRPGSHRGVSLGVGQEFVSHQRLLDRPDPRRVDLRASLRDLGGEWLVRVHRQRVGIAVHALVDVSASMRFGVPRTKQEIAADFVESLGQSAFRVGDAAGLLAFDARVRHAWSLPARHSRGMGRLMADMLGTCRGAAGGAEGLEDAARALPARLGLVFVVSDFHWPLARLGAALDALAHGDVVPLVVWSPAEVEPPAGDALAQLEDLESGHRRTMWLRPRVREAWRDAVASRRAELTSVFAARGMRPFFVVGGFDGDALSKRFLEEIP
jgi:hypothetical protein